MLRCSDVMPGALYEDVVETYGLPSKRQTYESVARLLLDQLDALNTSSGPVGATTAVETRPATITSVNAAIGRLLEAQVEDGCIPTQPSFNFTLRTESGSVFFNVNGYLGTVTEDGDLI